jgi:hypothetical protein
MSKPETTDPHAPDSPESHPGTIQVTDRQIQRYVARFEAIRSSVLARRSCSEACANTDKTPLPEEDTAMSQNEKSSTPAKVALHKMIDELPSSFSEEDCLFLAAIIGSFSALPPAALLQQLHSDCGPVNQGEMIKRTCIPSKGSEKDAKLQEILPDQFDPDTRTCQMNPEQRAQAATLEKMAGKLVGFDLPGDSS